MHQSESLCTCDFRVHDHLLFIKWVKTTGTHFVYMCFLCMWVNAHLCLRTLIGCVAIETLTLFWERVWGASVLSTVYVSYIINISCSVEVWSIRRLVQSVFMGCDHVAFCQLSNLWMKGVELLTLEKKIQHLNVQVHRMVHEMLAYCVTYSLLQFDDKFCFFLMKKYIWIYTLYTKFKKYLD